MCILIDVSDTTNISDGSLFAASQWWKRGWTLQEPLAPSKLTFFSSDWGVIGHKEFLGMTIAAITGISAEVFEIGRDLDSFSIAQRVSWASGRTTTRPEDTAYCLMGLFDVNMPILYGEGEKAFLRLQQEIIKDSDDESIFAWRDEPSLCNSYSGMLATRPAAFAGSQNVDSIYRCGHTLPYSMTNQGTDGKFVDIFLKKIYSEGMQFARIDSQDWIEGAHNFYDEITTIYVKQSWGGFWGFWGVYQMAMDIIDSRPPTDGSQDG